MPVPLRPVLPLVVLLLAGASLPDRLPAQTATPDRRIVLTFDDVPLTGGDLCDGGEVRGVTDALTGFLAERGLPSAALVTPGRPCLTAALLRETLGDWRAAGAALGNHTATHPDLDAVPLPAYLEDLERGRRLLEEAAPDAGPWFRPPLLHTGADPVRKEGLARHLAERGRRMAPVTVDNQEWVYAAVYVRALARGDDALARRVAEGYLAHVEESVVFYEALSRAVFDREIPQILLLHANRLNADHLPAVAALLEARGYRFVSLEEAMADPAYRRPDAYVGPRGLSWLQRWARADGVPVPDEPREAGWVAEAFRSGPS